MTNSQLATRHSFLDRPLLSSLDLNWEKLLYALLIIAAFVTRFYNLGVRVMSHDESLHTYFAFNLYEGKGFQHTPLMHGPLKFHLDALAYWLLGDSDFSARAPTALFGVAAVALPIFLRKWLGRAGALTASLLMLISPYMMYYSRYIRDEPMVVVWGLLMVLILFRYLEKPDTRWLYGLTAVTALFYTTMEASFIYVAIWLLFLGLFMLWDVVGRAWPGGERLKRVFLICVAGAFLALSVAGVFFYLGRNPQLLDPHATVEQLGPLPEDSRQIVPQTPYNRQIAVAAGFAAFFVLSSTAIFLFAFGQQARRFAVLDLVVVLWTFVMPQLTAFPVAWLGYDPLNYTPPTLEASLPLSERAGLFLASDVGVTAIVVSILFILSVAIGIAWDWRKWLICAGIFYGIFFVFFTTIFTNGNGWATGLIGSLGYWLAQQGVRRGNQPPYYYVLVQIPIYEFLPALGAIGAMVYSLIRWIRAEERATTAEGRPQTALEGMPNGEARALSAADDPPPGPLGARPPVVPFLAFWSAAAVVAFTLAGEKMPWLTTHITLPFILLAGWFFGHMLERIDWPALAERGGWIAALLLPMFVVSLVSAILPWLGTSRPFAGRELAQLQVTFGFLAALIVTVGLGLGLFLVGRRLGWKPLAQLAGLSAIGLLALLTARAAIFASFVNYDNATEYLVYAHGAPAVKRVMAQIEDISRRTTDGLGLRVAYDDDVSWPMTWYFRNYYNQVFYGAQPTRESLDVPVIVAGDSNWAKVEPLLGDRYYTFEYIRMWWPMQEYFNLNWDRVREALTKPEWREAIWDIWWARDYTKYGQLTATDYSLSRWPVADRMKLYVRKDIAAQIWDYGVGPTELSQALPEDPFQNLKKTRAADLTFGAAGNSPGQFQYPRDLAFAPDDSLYVADTRNHRIQKFDANGKFLLTWGSFGDVQQNTAAPGTFNEPWGIAVDSKGNVYVSDTWNHRIQKFDANGAFLTTWGAFGTGEADPYLLWGPRGLAVDSQDRLYVADTGNKRILVFDADGNSLGTLGSPGSLDGQFDEPVGVAVAADGRVFIADTWNQRVQVFGPDWQYAAQWPIVGWYSQSLDNKPYLTLDGKGLVYVTDPEGYRVLVFTEDGEPVETWGDYGADGQTFALPSGIRLDSEGRIWVTDANNNRVMRFPPLP